MPSSKSVTRGGQIVDALRGEILSGRYAPGMPLRLAMLAEAHETSVAVVRESLLRLSEQHLVTQTENAGFRVRQVSAADLDDLTETRVLIEGRALRESIERGDAAWEAEVIAAHHLLRRTPPRATEDEGTSDEWSAAHARFHHVLISACGSPRLLSLSDSLRDSAELYRQLSVEATLHTGRDVHGEHDALRDAALDREPELAERLLADHLRRTTDLIRPVLQLST